MLLKKWQQIKEAVDREVAEINNNSFETWYIKNGNAGWSMPQLKYSRITCKFLKVLVQ
jgi:hypothetical protein